MGKWKRNLAAVSIAVSFALLAGCVGFNNATSAPITRMASVELGGLPRNARPIRVALLSDIHAGNLAMRPERLSRIVASVNSQRPDIVLLAGDFITGETKDGAARRAKDLAPLADLRARQGVFAVLGNHDHWTDADAIRRSLKDAGIQTLENEAVRLGAITIVGIGDRFSGHDDIRQAARLAAGLGGIPVAFTHSPDLSPDLPETFPLLLAGHTHCGQMVAPVIGPIVRYHQWKRLYDPRYRCGRIADENRLTFVTAGVGPGAVPLRFNAMPDWWLIELKPKAAPVAVPTT